MSQLELIADWLLGGDTGSSSKFMAAHLTGRKGDGWNSYPSDPADMGRCLRLLRAVPSLRLRLSEMASASAYWAALVARWGEVEQSMLDEVGIDWEKARSAPKTYALMDSIFRPIQDADPNVFVIRPDDAERMLSTIKMKRRRGSNAQAHATARMDEGSSESK